MWCRQIRGPERDGALKGKPRISTHASATEGEETLKRTVLVSEVDNGVMSVLRHGLNAAQPGLVLRYHEPSRGIVVFQVSGIALTREVRGLIEA